MVMKNSAQNVDKTSDNNFGVTISEENYPAEQLAATTASEGYPVQEVQRGT